MPHRRAGHAVQALANRPIAGFATHGDLLTRVCRHTGGTCRPAPAARKHGGSGTARRLRQATKMTSRRLCPPGRDPDGEGFIDKVHTVRSTRAPANRAGSPGLIPWSKGRTRRRVFADKAYASKAKRDALRGRHRDGITRTGRRHPPIIDPWRAAG